MPSNIPVSAFGGKSLFGLLMGSISANMVRARRPTTCPFRITRSRALPPPPECRARALRAASARRLPVLPRPRRLRHRIGVQPAALRRAAPRLSPSAARQLVGPALTADDDTGWLTPADDASQAHFPTGPALDDKFWLYLITYHMGLFLAMFLGQIGVQARKQGYFDN